MVNVFVGLLVFFVFVGILICLSIGDDDEGDLEVDDEVDSGVDVGSSFVVVKKCC